MKPLRNQLEMLRLYSMDIIDTEDHDTGDGCFHGTTPPDEATLEPGAKLEQLAMLPTSPVLDKSRG